MDLGKAEGAASECSVMKRLTMQRLGSEVAALQESEAAGLSDGRGELRRRCPAGERREHDRMSELIKDHGRCLARTPARQT